MTCQKCKETFGNLAHQKYNKMICNKCCETSNYVNGMFKGCECEKEQNENNTN